MSDAQGRRKPVAHRSWRRHMAVIANRLARQGGQCDDRPGRLQADGVDDHRQPVQLKRRRNDLRRADRVDRPEPCKVVARRPAKPPTATSWWCSPTTARRSPSRSNLQVGHPQGEVQRGRQRSATAAVHAPDHYSKLVLQLSTPRCRSPGAAGPRRWAPSKDSLALDFSGRPSPAGVEHPAGGGQLDHCRAIRWDQSLDTVLAALAARSTASLRGRAYVPV